MQLAKGLSQSFKAKGGGCSFGTITNKSETDRENLANFVNSWLPGKSVTASVGFFGIVGGVTVPYTQEWFDPKAQIGVEWGGEPQELTCLKVRHQSKGFSKLNF